MAADPRPTKIEVLRVGNGLDLPLPHRMTEAAAGFDLSAAIGPQNQILLNPGERALVATGIALHLPVDMEAQVRPRSGLAFRHGVTVLNTPGTIDADYRGEIKVVLINLGQEPFVIRHGERIAQLVFSRVLPVVLVETQSLPTSERGDKGFGSTGLDTGKRNGP
jgi:dUTP pyrophosphatase